MYLIVFCISQCKKILSSTQKCYFGYVFSCSSKILKSIVVTVAPNGKHMWEPIQERATITTE